MTDAAPLQLVILYDARRNEYMVVSHNLTPDEARKRASELSAQKLPALTVTQRQRHSADDPEDCRTCRDDVKRAAGLTPSPKFSRRTA